MRFSAACFNIRAVGRHPPASPSHLLSRATSISFVGLGRMGSEMAFNLFSKRYALGKESGFVVCDAVPEAALAFTTNFQSQFPGSQVRVVNTPEE